MVDVNNSTNISTADKIYFLNSAMAATWDLLVEAGDPEFYCTRVLFNTVANQRDYAIGTIAPTGDFYKARAVYVNDGTTSVPRLRQLDHLSASEVYCYQAPNAVVPMELHYIPLCPVLVANGDTFNGINGWEEHTLMQAACDIKAKREEDNSYFYRKKMELEERIKRMNKRDVGTPQVIQRRYKRIDPLFFYRNTVNGYRLVGSTLELYMGSTRFLLP